MPMDAERTRAPRNTGPIELRDFGPNGRRLGTPDDCYDGSPWELHRGELVEQMGSKDIHAIVMALLAALFSVHARDGITTMADVYCELSDEQGQSLRAPDVVLVKDLLEPKDAAYSGIPVLAVEIRGTQSKRYLEEKVKLYFEHDWPEVWIVHAEREEVEILRPGLASVVYRKGSEVPLPEELDKYGLTKVPVSSFFDQQEVTEFVAKWVHAHGETRGRLKSIHQVLLARGLDVPSKTLGRMSTETDLAKIDRWITLAATAPDVSTFVNALD